MKWIAGGAFLALFATWAYLEFVSGTHESLKEAIFWAAMFLIFVSGIEPRPKRPPSV